MTELVCLDCFTTYYGEQGHVCVNGCWMPVIPNRNIPFQLIENDQVIWTKEFVIKAFQQYLREHSDILNRNPEFSADADIHNGIIYDNDRLVNSNQDSVMRIMPGEHDISELSNDLCVENKEKNQKEHEIIELSNDLSVENKETNQKEHESKMDNNTDPEMTSDEIRQAEKNPQWSKYGRNTPNNLIKNQKCDPHDDFAIKEAEIALSLMANKISTVNNKDDFAKITVFKSNQMKPNSNNIEKIQDECTILSTSYEIGLKNTDFQTAEELPEEDASNIEKPKLANECSIVHEHAAAGPSQLDFNEHNCLAREEHFKCELCKKYFPSFETWKQHEQLHIEEFTCCICQKKLSHQRGLRRHIKNIHNKIRRFECEICEMKFFFKRSLKLHKKEIHTKKE